MPVPPSPPRCWCRCHEASSYDRHHPTGVSYEDPLEAAVACPACQPYHAVALLSMRLANAPAPRIVEKGQWVDPDPKKKAKPDEQAGGTDEAQDDGN